MVSVGGYQYSPRNALTSWILFPSPFPPSFPFVLALTICDREMENISNQGPTNKKHNWPCVDQNVATRPQRGRQTTTVTHRLVFCTCDRHWPSLVLLLAVHKLNTCLKTCARSLLLASSNFFFVCLCLSVQKNSSSQKVDLDMTRTREDRDTK